MSNALTSSWPSSDITNLPKPPFLHDIDGFLCNSFYGEALMADDCRRAVSELPFAAEDEPMPFATNPRNPRTGPSLPIYRTSRG